MSARYSAIAFTGKVEGATMRAAALSVMAVIGFAVLALLSPPARSQDKPAPPALEYRAVAFGADAQEATRKLNELAAQGWEYVGPLGNSLVAFKRPRPPVVTGADLFSRVAKLGGQIKKVKGFPEGKEILAYDVDFKGTQIADADLATLGPMQDVWYLDLSFTRVTNKAIAALAGHKSIRSLSLVGTKVNDAAIPDLRALPSLDSINLGATGVTAEGIAQLVKDKTCTVCPIAQGDKSRFRVFQDFREGELRFNYLMINDTYYGRYYVGKSADPPGTPPEDRRRLATTYYHRYGPVGAVMRKLETFKPASLLDYPTDARLPASLVGMLAAPCPLPAAAFVDLWSEPALAVVRLNVGTHAAYARPFQQIHYYSSTPELKEYCLPRAGQPVYFGFIRDAAERGAHVALIDGSERRGLATAPKSYYGAMFVDVTRNDLRDINTAILTREAMRDMMASLTETGVLCFHTSHRYHDLLPPIIDAAASLKFSWKVGQDSFYEGGAVGHFSSQWVMVARKAAYLNHLTDVQTKEQNLQWQTPASTGKHLWHDGKEHDLKSLAR
jgi:hypothetical protein